MHHLMSPLPYLYPLLLLACPKPLIINNTPTWEPVDRAALERASAGCETYYPTAPCLKRFTKKDTRQYEALCGV